MEIGLLDQLIKSFAKLPGLGPRSGRRIALHLLKNKRQSMLDLSDLIKLVAEEIKTCSECGNLDVKSPCGICSSQLRDKQIICVVEDVSDLWAIERGDIFKGVYHVLGGTLSAIEGRTPDKLNLPNLLNRVDANGAKEVIIATNSNLEGQTTGFYVADILQPFNVKTSRLAHGIPIGAELDYLDEGTLSHALKMRQDY
ncbi:MAG: recombination protein RecR [Candidatus Midichloriaceae bacterium]|jgi:recombination protein RecR|nr:recombination protein RecR [Candidatus Midichloriaceae bacterium]